MQVAFLGAEPKAGTSANMQLAAWGAFFHPVLRERAGIQKAEFTDFGQWSAADLKQISSWDLLAVNLSLIVSFHSSYSEIINGIISKSVNVSK